MNPEATDLTEKFKQLREPFKEGEISLLPRPTKKENPSGKCKECGGWHGLPAIHLSYVGHAALTDRLLKVDPFWQWEPLAFTNDGLPLLDKDGGLWIKLTICGITRLGYGDAQGKTGPNATKERIGDALRNAGMRFGIALDLWHKGELYPEQEEPEQAKPASKAMTVIDGGQTEKAAPLTFHESLVAGCKAAYRAAKVNPTPGGLAAALGGSTEEMMQFFNGEGKFVPSLLDDEQLFRVTFFAEHGNPAQATSENIAAALLGLQEIFNARNEAAA